MYARPAQVSILASPKSHWTAMSRGLLSHLGTSEHFTPDLLLCRTHERLPGRITKLVGNGGTKPKTPEILTP